MTCCRCSAPAIMYLPGVAGWCVRHAMPLAKFAAQRLEELEESRRPLLRGTS